MRSRSQGATLLRDVVSEVLQPRLLSLSRSEQYAPMKRRSAEALPRSSFQCSGCFRITLPAANFKSENLLRGVVQLRRAVRTLELRICDSPRESTSVG